MIRRPPSSTLFPTRRSSDLDPFDRLLGVPAGEVGDALAAGVEAGAAVDDAGDALYDQLRLRSCEDRKSTRLNSSHRTISYAVFCLKKKNKYKYKRLT